ncbi:MAG: S46 family peptidase [bacterium]|nr:S46 family peptidase [bacterium]
MKKIIVTLVVMLCLNLVAFGDEGMWLLNQLKNLELEKKGFEITASDIYDPGKPCIAHAIIDLGGGTAEFISANGLILTNHHVAFGAVQRASTKGTDYITNGFLAKTLAEEIEAPGYAAEILHKMTDVTAQFKRFDKIKDPVERDKAIERKITAMIKKTEKGKKDISAKVKKMYNGKQYFLFINKRYEDVRVVYVPPSAIGNYGGDIDNWMWPRHTGDFSFMRVYMAPDGTGRKPHKDNVPFKPKYWLKIAKDGLKKGDQTFIMGYPGRTTRYRTSYSVAESLNHVYPNSIKYFSEVIELLEDFAKDSQIARAKVAGLDKGLNNAMKNFQGNIDGMTRTNFIQQKIDFENQLTAFLKKDETLFKIYGNVLPKIKTQYDFMAKYREVNYFFRMGRFIGGNILSAAQRAYNDAREREKPKKLRDLKFSEKQNKRYVDQLKYRFMSFYEPADKALLKKALKWIYQLPEDVRPMGLVKMLKDSGKTIDQWVDDAYKNTKLKDLTNILSLFNKSSKQLEALNDPFITLAKYIHPDREAYKKRDNKDIAILKELRRKYIDALYAWKGADLYPDANDSIRFSWGRVDGYQPRDAVYYEPFTTIKGMLEKDTGKEPFNMPEGLKKLHAKKDFGRWMHPDLKDVPIAYTHKVDSTGGNSGSPVMNAKGELVGILFDGNYEAMTGDWQYDPVIQRSISVDIRYVMFVTEKLANAKNILKELGL